MSRTRITRTALAVLIAAGAGGAALLATAAPAAAVTVAMTSAVASPVSAVATATCAAGLNLVNASGIINGGGGNVVMTDVIPDLATNTATVWGHEVGAFAGNWSVTAIAVCEPIAVARVAAASPNNSASPKTVNPMCPAGSRLTGLGYELVNGNGQVFPSAARPSGILDGATMIAAENGAYAPNWQLTGYAICANPAGFAPSLVTTATGSNSVTPKSPASICPAGTMAFGGGGEVGGAGVGNVVLDALILNPAQTQAVSRAQEFGAFAGNWSLTAYAICW